MVPIAHVDVHIPDDVLVLDPHPADVTDQGARAPHGIGEPTEAAGHIEQPHRQTAKKQIPVPTSINRLMLWQATHALSSWKHHQITSRVTKPQLLERGWGPLPSLSGYTTAA